MNSITNKLSSITIDVVNGELSKKVNDDVQIVVYRNMWLDVRSCLQNIPSFIHLKLFFGE